MSLSCSQENNIVLVGFMGSGKSSVGRRIADSLNSEFVDTDSLVTAAEGRSITDIFAQNGEEYFRRCETTALRSLADRKRLVIATGGGIVTRAENHPLLKQLGFVAWLTATEEILFQRVSRNSRRPLLQTENPRETLRSLLNGRLPLYEKVADWTIDTSILSHQQVADALISEAHRFFSCKCE